MAVKFSKSTFSKSHSLFRRQKGFTLLELTVVIAIIIVLSAVIVPTGLRILERSRVSALAVDIESIKSVAIEYYTEQGEWPQAQDSFTSSTTSDGPYLDRWPVPPWQGSTVTWVSVGPYIQVAGLPAGKSEALKDILGGQFEATTYSLFIR